VTSFRAYTSKHETPVTSPDVPQDRDESTKLDYPKHPFSPHLSETIATKLPDGFSEIAIKRQLSLQVIDLLVDLHEQQLGQSRPPPTDAEPSLYRHIYSADKCLQYLRSTSMPDLERMITGGVLAYSITTHPPRSRTRVYDDSLRSFLAELAQYIYFHYDSEVLLWITYSFASVAEHIFVGDEMNQSASANHFFQHTVMRFTWTKTWAGTERVLKKFLWDENRLEEWKRRWEEFVRPPEVGVGQRVVDVEMEGVDSGSRSGRSKSGTPG
jgi:hypothetical protein